MEQNKNNILAVFDEREVLGKEFRIYGTFDEPLFLAKDVAEWIDYAYKNKSKGTRNVNMMVSTVDEEEKLVATILTSGQRREVTMLTEDGLYEVLMQSRKPIAKQFKKEVKEILKSIRRKGIYATPETAEKIFNDPDFGIRLLKELKSEREQRMLLENKIEEQAPLVELSNNLIASDGSVDMNQMAKILKDDDIKNIGRNRLFEFLRKEKILMSDNTPYQRYVEQGYFEVIDSIENKSVYAQTFATPKGQAFVTKMVREKYRN